MAGSAPAAAAPTLTRTEGGGEYLDTKGVVKASMLENLHAFYGFAQAEKVTLLITELAEIHLGNQGDLQAAKAAKQRCDALSEQLAALLKEFKELAPVEATRMEDIAAQGPLAVVQTATQQKQQPAEEMTAAVERIKGETKKLLEELKEQADLANRQIPVLDLAGNPFHIFVAGFALRKAEAHTRTIYNEQLLRCPWQFAVNVLWYAHTKTCMDILRETLERCKQEPEQKSSTRRMIRHIEQLLDMPQPVDVDATHQNFPLLPKRNTKHTPAALHTIELWAAWCVYGSNRIAGAFLEMVGERVCKELIQVVNELTELTAEKQQAVYDARKALLERRDPLHSKFMELMFSDRNLKKMLQDTITIQAGMAKSHVTHDSEQQQDEETDYTDSYRALESVRKEKETAEKKKKKQPSSSSVKKDQETTAVVQIPVAAAALPSVVEPDPKEEDAKKLARQERRELERRQERKQRKEEADRIAAERADAADKATAFLKAQSNESNKDVDLHMLLRPSSAAKLPTPANPPPNKDPQ